MRSWVISLTTYSENEMPVSARTSCAVCLSDGGRVTLTGLRRIGFVLCNAIGMEKTITWHLTPVNYLILLHCGTSRDITCISLLTLRSAPLKFAIWHRVPVEAPALHPDNSWRRPALPARARAPFPVPATTLRPGPIASPWPRPRPWPRVRAHGRHGLLEARAPRTGRRLSVPSLDQGFDNGDDDRGQGRDQPAPPRGSVAATPSFLLHSASARLKN